jgi:cobalamin-dependent methionine synthase I
LAGASIESTLGAREVWRLLDLESIGMTFSGGYAVIPEQSTVAIVAHHHPHGRWE